MGCKTTSWILHSLFLTSFLVNQANSDAESDAEFAFVFSEQGINDISNFGLSNGLKALEASEPIEIRYDSKQNPKFRPVANLDVLNILGIGGIKVNLLNNSLALEVNDLSIETEANLIADFWPLPVPEETLYVNLTLPKTFVTIETRVEENGDKQLYMSKCNFEDLSIATRTKNYWLMSGAIKLATFYLQHRIESIVCPMLKERLMGTNKKFSFAVPLRTLVNANKLPKNIRRTAARYDLMDLQIQDGYLGASISMSWVPPPPPRKHNSTLMLDEDADDLMEKAGNSMIEVALAQANGHHVMIWIHENVFNDALRLITWDFELMKDKVPVSDPKIPEDSRRFLSTLCDDCYFVLNVWMDGAPYLKAHNGSFVLHTWDRIKLWVVNPRKKTSSIFIKFNLFFDGLVEPYIESGHLKSKVALQGVNVTMEESAFPSAWGDFVGVLVKDMIKGMIWPGVQKMIDKVLNGQGIPLPKSCGIDPSTATIKIDAPKMGIGADLTLDTLDIAKCGRDFRDGLPKIKLSAELNQNKKGSKENDSNNEMSKNDKNENSTRQNKRKENVP